MTFYPQSNGTSAEPTNIQHQDTLQRQSQAVAASCAQQGATVPAKQVIQRGKKKPLAPLAVNPGPLVPLYLPRPLQAGWISLFDPASRLPFYYHPASKHSQWQAPLVPLPSLPPPWIEASEPTRGLPYYYNPLTKTSQWERPVGPSVPQEGLGLPQKLAPAGVMMTAGRRAEAVAATGRPNLVNGMTSATTPPLLKGPLASTAGVRNVVAQICGLRAAAAQSSAAQFSTIKTAPVWNTPVQVPAIQLPTFQTPPVWTPAVQDPSTQTPAVQISPVQTPAVQTSAAQLPKIESSAMIPIRPSQTPAVQQQPAFQMPAVQSLLAPSVGVEPLAFRRPTLETASPSAEAVLTSAIIAADTATKPTVVNFPRGQSLPAVALTVVQAQAQPAQAPAADMVAKHAAYQPASLKALVSSLTAVTAGAGGNTGLKPETLPAEAAQGPFHAEQMEGAQGQLALTHPTAVDEPVGMVVEAGPQDMIESVADMPIPCLECACLGPVTRDGLCRTCAKLPVTASPTLLQLSPAPQTPSEPPSKRGRKRVKPPLYSPPLPRAAELASNGRDPPVQLPDEILETIVKMVAAAKPRSNSPSPYQGFYSYSFKSDSEYELRVDERLTARDLANLCQVAKDWKRGVETVGWPTLLDGIAETCYPGSDVRKGQKDGSAKVTLQAMHAASATIVATKAAVEYKVKTEELRAQAKPFKVKRNPHRRSGQMRIYNVKDVLDLALAKHGGAAGLRAKIEKCEATARKRAANGGARPGRKPRGRAWPLHHWDSEWDGDSEYYSDEFEPWRSWCL